MDRTTRDNPLAGAMRETRLTPRLPALAGERERDESRAAARPDPPTRTRPRAHRRGSARRSLSELLGSRSALRRAIVITEIIGPPKSLRRDDEPAW